MANRRNTNTAQTKALELVRAQERVCAARMALARASKPSDHRPVIHGDGLWARPLLEAKGKSLLAIKGVLGFGLSHDRGVLHAIVYVDNLRRRSLRELPVRLSRSKSKQLEIRIVELRDFENTLDVGESVGPSNAAIKGTIGAFAVDGNNTQWAITAMHVAGRSELPASAPPLTAFSPSHRDVPQSPAIGSFVEGTSIEVDAVKILLQGPSARTGLIKGWRPVVDPGDRGLPVHLYGATSGLIHGQIVTPNTDLPALQLKAAIVAQIATQPGDSGAALLDEQGLVVGFLKGRAPGNPLAVFSSAGLVLDRLGCDIPTV